MDGLVAFKVMEHMQQKTENKETYANSNSRTSFDSNAIGSIIGTIFSIIIGIAAAYLSWDCNTSLGIDTGLKALYAFFAFIFGFLYILFYFIFRAGTCSGPQKI